MEKIFVDTSAWVALFSQNDAHYQKAARSYQILRAENNALYTSDYVVSETITTVLVRSDHHRAVTVGKALFGSEVIKMISVSPDYLELAWENFQKYKDKQFSFTDVSSFVICKNLNIQKVFTFDEDFKQAGFQIVN